MLDEDQVTDQGAQPLSPDESAKFDQLAASASNPNDVAPEPDYVSRLNQGPGVQSPANKLAQTAKGVGQFVGAHKKPFIGGGAGTGIISLVLLGLPFLGGFEMIHIEMIMQRDAFKVINHAEQKIDNKLMQHALLRALNKSNPNSSLNQDSDGPLAQEEEKINFQNLEPELESNGIKLELNSQGDPVKLTDTQSGKSFSESELSQSDFLEGHPDITANINKAVPTLAAAEITNYIPEMTEDANVDFSGFKPEDDKDIKKAITEKVRNGASAEQAAAQLSESEQDQPTSGTPQEQKTQQAELDSEKANSGELKDAIDATTKEFNNSSNAVAAIEAGEEAALKHSLGAGVASPLNDVTTVCTLKKMANEALKARTLALMQLLMRHGNLFLTMSSQLRDGKMSGKAVGTVLSGLNGDPKAKDPKTGKRQEASYPFSSAKSWQQATGGSGGFPLDPAANPDSTTAATSIIHTIDDVSSKVPGSGAACAATTGKVGFFVNGIASVVALVGNVLDGESVEAAGIAQNIAFQTALYGAVVPELLKLATGLAITGTDAPTQQINNGAFGLHLSAADDGRQMGALPVNDTVQHSLTAEANKAQQAYDNHQSLYNQLLATSNPDSVATRFLAQLPTTGSGMVQGALHLFSAMPQIFTRPLSSWALADAATSDSVGDYNVYNYSLTDDQIEKYDFAANEYWMRHTQVVVSVDKKGNPTVIVTPIQAMGDPTANPVGSDDPNSWDMLHCFRNAISNFDPNGDPDSTCGTVGRLIPKPGDDHNTSYVAPNPLSSFCHFADANGCVTSGATAQEALARLIQYMNDARGMGAILSLSTDDGAGASQ